MICNYSLKHTDGDLGKPLLGTELPKEESFWGYKDTEDWFVLKTAGNDGFILNFTLSHPVWHVFFSDWKNDTLDRQFLPFPKGTVMSFTQDSLESGK